MPIERAKATTAPGLERYSERFMPDTIASAIDDSKRQFTDCYRRSTIDRMSKTKKRHPETPQVRKLKQLVADAGGPTAFAKKYSTLPDEPIDHTYVSQILNGHRPFRDSARENMAKRAGLPLDYFEAAPAEYGTSNNVVVVRAEETRPMWLMSNDEIDLVAGFRNAPQAVKESTLDHLRMYAKTEREAS